MTINVWVADFLARALAAEVLPIGGDILEFGESTFDLKSDPPALFQVIEPHVPEERFREALRRYEEAKHCVSHYHYDAGPARAFYHAVFAPRLYVAVELGLVPRRLCLDLNGRVRIERQFDCVINNGTCQHVFDQANFYRVMHEATRAGGTILHWTPCIGWINHGLYTIQPGFFFDLATANDYSIKLIGLMAPNVFFPMSTAEDYRQGLARFPALAQAVVGVVLQKSGNRPFVPPLQEPFAHGPPESYALARTPRQYAPDTRPNLALNKPALQSSTGPGSSHDDPVQDAAGGNNGMVTGYYSFCTAAQIEPWWQVDLGASIPLQEVVVYNRIDTFPRGAVLSSHLRVFLSADGEHWSRVFERHDDEPFGGADGKPLRVLLYGREARFVRLGLPGHGILCLDEVEVY